MKPADKMVSSVKTLTTRNLDPLSKNLIIWIINLILYPTKTGTGVFDG